MEMKSFGPYSVTNAEDMERLATVAVAITLAGNEAAGAAPN